jgi:hypothetical protein
MKDSAAPNSGRTSQVNQEHLGGSSARSQGDAMRDGLDSSSSPTSTALQFGACAPPLVMDDVCRHHPRHCHSRVSALARVGAALWIDCNTRAQRLSLSVRGCSIAPTASPAQAAHAVELDIRGESLQPRRGVLYRRGSERQRAQPAFPLPLTEAMHIHDSNEPSSCCLKSWLAAEGTPSSR